MPNTVVRTYDNLSAAEKAREALLSNGFAPDDVQLRVMQTESGPVENNSWLPEKDTGTGPKDEFGFEERTDAYGNSTPIWGANVLLTVDGDDEDRLARASDIMDEYGAIDVQARGDRASPTH